MKKSAYIIGGSLVVSAAAAIMYRLLNNRKKKKCDVCYNCQMTENQEAAKDTSLMFAETAQEEPAYEDVKSSAIGNMYARHQSASNIMKESIDAIRENVKVSEDTNNEMDRISAELDQMLRED